MKMTLNYKRTLFVGFAFFLICAFWQAYDNIIPKILTDKFGLPQVWSGAIMALDNVFALFLLPIFGAISDKVSTRFGRRKPFVAIGAVVAAALLICLAIPDMAQLHRIERVSATTGEAYTEALEELWNANPTVTVEGKEKNQPLQTLIEKEAFLSITLEDTGYNTFVVPARQAFAANATAENALPLVAFMALLFFILIAMGTFRSPAVALMPDVTPAPLRSKANAIINLMGAVGGLLVLVLGILLGTGQAENALMSYTVYFAVIAAIMLLSLAVFLFTVKENEWAAEAREAQSEIPTPQSLDTPAKKRTLSPEERRSFWLLLASVIFWFAGYNAVTSKYSVYAGTVLNMDYNTTLLIANAAAIVSYVPIGFLSSKFGRKKMILGGITLLATAFFAACFMRAGSPKLLMNVFFVMAGLGWASIGVNSYPMVVELASGDDVGRYTGFYYTASMSAQICTPILSGFFMDNIHFTALFPYATVFVILSFITMLFVKHGDTKPASAAVALEESEDA